MKFLTFDFIVIATFAIASNVVAEDASCSPLGGYCRLTDDCCRHLLCLTYAAKCVSAGGPIVLGQDTRPIGDGPYPPTNSLRR